MTSKRDIVALGGNVQRKIKNVVVLFCSLFMLTVVLPCHAKPDNVGIAVKFFGLGTAGKLSDRIIQSISKSNIDVTGFDCFELPVLDPASERKLGIGVDCLRPISTEGDSKGEGLQLEAITFFFFKNGMLVNRGCTSVRPFFEGIGNSGVTHMTGSIDPTEFGAKINSNAPEVCKSNQGIIYSTGSFRHLTGGARLSGAVNLSNADNGQIKFSCLFVLKLHKRDSY